MADHADIDHTGITGAGGSVATDAIFDAKGDLAVGTGANTAAKLTVGANDTIPMADSGQATGIKWVASQTPSTQAFGDAAAEGTADTYARGDHKHAMPADPGGGGAIVQIADTTLGATATNITFSGIANSYNHLLVLVQARSDRAGTVFEGVNIQFNTDTGSNYDSVNPDFNTADAYAESIGGTSGFLASIPAADAPAGAAGTFEVRINNYKATVFHKSYFTNATVKYGTSSGNVHTVINSGHWRSTAAITEVKILTRNGSNFIVGTRATLYGLT